MMEKRRQLINRNISEYKRKYRLLLRTIRELWMKERCEELEEPQQKLDEFNIHRKIKHVATLHKRNTPITPTNNEVQVLSLEN